MPGRTSTVSKVFSVKQTLEKYWEHNFDIHQIQGTQDLLSQATRHVHEKDKPYKSPGIPGTGFYYGENQRGPYLPKCHNIRRY